MVPWAIDSSDIKGSWVAVVRDSLAPGVFLGHNGVPGHSLHEAAQDPSKPCGSQLVCPTV